MLTEHAAHFLLLRALPSRQNALTVGHPSPYRGRGTDFYVPTRSVRGDKQDSKPGQSPSGHLVASGLNVIHEVSDDRERR